jgi:Cu2+-exporting ATPase
MRCIHCGEKTNGHDEKFCCPGCEAAYKIINQSGFKNYYELREENFVTGKIKPEIAENLDISEFVAKEENQNNSVSLMIQGMHCAACIWLIENISKKQKDVIDARVNLSKKTLFLRWRGDAKYGNELIKLIQNIGYKLLPFDQEILDSSEKKYNDEILRALAVAGFGTGNVMLFSFSLWFADAGQMGIQTRNLLHFFSSLIALPVIIFSARPFFSSAIRSIKQGYPNMDLAISIAIFLACIVSLLETFRSANHVYFDSAVMLTFFLLIGRYLDLKARKKAFAIATEFTLLSANFGRVEEGGNIKILPSKNLKEGMILVVASGEKISADGIIIDGASELDTSLITGETTPKAVTKNSEVFAGMINLAQPLRIKITKSPQNSLLSEIIRLSDEAQSKKIHYVRLADYLSRFYTPAVHLLAFATFCFWFKSGWEVALMNATAVLIITCPCALALAVPIVQTITISNFIKKGVLIKSGEALEKLIKSDVIIFDKTGSLTIGKPKLIEIKILHGKEKNILPLAASLAKASKHPLSQAISESYDGKFLDLKIKENPGFGLEAEFENKTLRLGRKQFCDIQNFQSSQQNSLSCFFKFGENEAEFLFTDEIKSDAKAVISSLKSMGKEIILLSGDSKNPVESVAKTLEIDQFYFEQTPVSKAEFLGKFLADKKQFIMIGDGINDAPALALSPISISFSKAADISQNIADIIIQGEKLSPILEVINSSNRSISLMKQNLLIALLYNLIAVPFAISGHVVPLIAAIAMSSSSLIVLFNSLRCRS